jgi:hypothetical protein
MFWRLPVAALKARVDCPRGRWLSFIGVAVASIALSPVGLGTTAAQEAPPIGSEVEVAGAGDCLNVRAFAGKDAPILSCVSDGTRARLSGVYPYVLDGETWWELAGLGHAASRYLRVVGPPLPNLQSSNERSPVPAGLIAYVGDDGNIWTIRPDGSEQKQVTQDGGLSAQSAHYLDLSWSPSGRYLAVWRIGPAAGVTGDIRPGSAVVLYDQTTGLFRQLETQSGRALHRMYWMPDGKLAVAFILPSTLRGPPGSLNKRYDGGISVIDVETSVARDVLSWSGDELFGVGNLGPASQDGTNLAFATEGYEAVGPACTVDVSSGQHYCAPSDSWAPRGWIDHVQLVLRNDAYAGPYGPPWRPDLVLNSVTGVTRDRTPADTVVAPLAQYDERTGEVRTAERVLFTIPVQHNFSGLGDQPVAPDNSAVLFRIDQALWVGRTDGSNRAWVLVSRVQGSVAWQPPAASTANEVTPTAVATTPQSGATLTPESIVTPPSGSLAPDTGEAGGGAGLFRWPSGRAGTGLAVTLGLLGLTSSLVLAEIARRKARDRRS